MTAEQTRPVSLGSVNPFPEWREAVPNQPIRQGDILKSIERDDDPWRSLLVVITADCDLANKKHAGSLTCVPVLGVEEYLLQFKYDARRTSLLNQLISDFLRRYRKAAPVDEVREISEARLAEWIAETADGVLTETLGIHGTTAKRLEGIAEAARGLLNQAPRSVSEAASLIATGKFALEQGNDLDKIRVQQASNLAGTVETLPGDALFLNELSEIHRSGYVAYLRRVVELQDQQVTTAVPREESEASHIRISKLASPYVHALSQQFGAVFSAIGLPVEYEHARTSVVKRISRGVSDE